MKKLLFPILLALLLVTIVSCKKEEKKPTPSDPAKVFLAKEYYIINNDTTATTTYEWDNNHLKRVSKVEDPDINIHIESVETLNYDNGLLKENNIQLTDGLVTVNIIHSFIYENDRISKYIVTNYSDTTAVFDSFEFDSDGSITKMRYKYYEFKYEEEYLLTWENGDVVTITEGNHTYNYTYDDKPNIYTGFPLWKFGKDQLPLYSSKHNLINTDDYDYTYIGDKMVSKVRKSDGAETHYVYTDGTGR